MSKSKLIFEGSSGCIFRPQIPCDGSKSKKTKKKVSKLFVNKNKEFKIGLMVKKIPGHKKWTILWENICDSPEYSKILKNTDIKQCLLSKDVNPKTLPPDYKFTLYQGNHGGLTFENYSKKIVKSKIFSSNKEFIRIFKKIFKLIHNVFYGLVKLSENNICHHDINIGNILIKDNKSYIIDYDISLKINDKLNENSDLINRISEEYNSYRIYEIYPYEYIYYNLKDKKDILNEQRNIALYQNRLNYYEMYIPIYHSLFNIDTDNLRFDLLEDKLLKENKQNLKELIKKLDVYSLGITILIFFIESSERLNINIDKMIELFKLKQLKPYLDLIKDMIAFDYRERIDIHTAYERYLNLI